MRGSIPGAGLLALLLVASCSDGSTTTAARGPAGAVPHADAAVSVVPLDRAGNVPTHATVLVAASGGTLRSVTVKGPRNTLTGVLSADGTQWHSQDTALPGTTYEVTAVAVNPEGKSTETRTSFSTVKAAKTFEIKEFLPDKELTGLTVGVGMPVMITFDQPITDRVEVERNLTIRTSKPVLGAWHWFDDKTVHFRPKTFWPANTTVRVDADLEGVRGGRGVYGKRDQSIRFRVGRSQITRGSTLTHHLTVRRNGKVVRQIPMSAGQGGVWKYHTTSGVHLAMSREPVTVMTSPGIGPGSPGYYQMTVYNTVRISNSGEYVHSAPWSVGSQGYSNVSHGCVNISPANAAWFIDNTLIGDPIIITGTPRQLEPTNGWGHWQEDWRQWLKWSSVKYFTTDSL
ncbi:Ig-like domain-containing protein [Streptosporangium algeriense]|uniref:Ig-like domain-containing protein n=1 Tax=Streptosporangium algeriense TaxID=1682748 RepID=A0ABW3DIC2_9ACTN